MVPWEVDQTPGVEVVLPYDIEAPLKIRKASWWCPLLVAYSDEAMSTAWHPVCLRAAWPWSAACL